MSFKLWLESGPSQTPEIDSSHVSNLNISREEIDKLENGDTLTDQSGEEWAFRRVGLPERYDYFIATSHPNETWKPGEVRILRSEEGIIPTYRGYRPILKRVKSAQHSPWGV